MSDPACHLCGLPLRYGTVTQKIDTQPLHFCCQGCSMVYTMLLESAEVDDPASFKQTDLYRQCVAAGVIPASEDELQRIHQPERPAARNQPADGGMPSQRLDALNLNMVVDGMWCTACAWVVEKAVAGLPGVTDVRCHFSTDRLRCSYRPEQVAPDQIRDLVERLGYTARDVDDADHGLTGRRRELIRLLVTALLSANVMMLSWALYAGFFTDLSSDAVSKISLPIVVMAVAAFLYGGGPMLRKAWFGLRHGAPGMEALVGLGAGCALVYSLFNWMRGSIHLYFDTACMLITLVLLGKFLEQQARGRVRRDLDSFFALQPTKVRMISDQWPKGKYVAIERLQPGDRYCVESDEIVPADGRVASGMATLDESALTGEPRPVRIKTGSLVKSGTRVLEGRITARAVNVGPETILGRMIAIMSRSLEQKSAFESRTDRMLRWFVPVIVGLSGTTGLICLWQGLSVDQSVIRAVTVMVISCPCALGVAIPMARLAGISLAGRNGMLVREIEAFERAVAIDCVVFDKTGTLTRGRWDVIHINSHGQVSGDDVLALAAGLERSSDHEIARAIRAYAKERGVDPAAVTDVTVFPDGVQGRSGKRCLRIGSPAFAWNDARPARDTEGGQPERLTSRVFFSVNGHPAATLLFGDRIRPSVPSMVTDLKKEIADIHLISGDGETATQSVAESVGLTQAHGELLPTDKAGYIQSLTDRGRQVAMVGDGVNDAAAMAVAHLAVAVHSGQGLAKEAAHITLMRGDPSQLLDFLLLSRQVSRKVLQNLWCAWIYNLISIPVAMSGLLTPLVAATAMLLSSLTVIGNTLLLVRRG